MTIDYTRSSQSATEQIPAARPTSELRVADKIGEQIRNKTELPALFEEHDNNRINALVDTSEYELARQMHIIVQRYEHQKARNVVADNEDREKEISDHVYTAFKDTAAQIVARIGRHVALEKSPTIRAKLIRTVVDATSSRYKMGVESVLSTFNAEKYSHSGLIVNDQQLTQNISRKIFGTEEKPITVPLFSRNSALKESTARRVYRELVRESSPSEQQHMVLSIDDAVTLAQNRFIEVVNKQQTEEEKIQALFSVMATMLKIPTRYMPGLSEERLSKAWVVLADRLMSVVNIDNQSSVECFEKQQKVPALFQYFLKRIKDFFLIPRTFYPSMQEFSELFYEVGLNDITKPTAVIDIVEGENLFERTKQGETVEVKNEENHRPNASVHAHDIWDESAAISIVRRRFEPTEATTANGFNAVESHSTATHRIDTVRHLEKLITFCKTAKNEVENRKLPHTHPYTQIQLSLENICAGIISSEGAAKIELYTRAMNIPGRVSAGLAKMPSQSPIKTFNTLLAAETAHVKCYAIKEVLSGLRKIIDTHSLHSDASDGMLLHLEIDIEWLIDSMEQIIYKETVTANDEESIITCSATLDGNETSTGSYMEKIAAISTRIVELLDAEKKTLLAKEEKKLPIEDVEPENRGASWFELDKVLDDEYKAAENSSQTEEVITADAQTNESTPLKKTWKEKILGVATAIRTKVKNVMNEVHVKRATNSIASAAEAIHESLSTPSWKQIVGFGVLSAYIGTQVSEGLNRAGTFNTETQKTLIGDNEIHTNPQSDITTNIVTTEAQTVLAEKTEQLAKQQNTEHEKPTAPWQRSLLTWGNDIMSGTYDDQMTFTLGETGARGFMAHNHGKIINNADELAHTSTDTPQYIKVVVEKNEGFTQATLRTLGEQAKAEIQAHADIEKSEATDAAIDEIITKILKKTDGKAALAVFAEGLSSDHQANEHLYNMLDKTDSSPKMKGNMHLVQENSGYILDITNDKARGVIDDIKSTARAEMPRVQATSNAY